VEQCHQNFDKSKVRETDLDMFRRLSLGRINFPLLHIWTASLTYGFWASAGDHDLTTMMVVPDSAGDAS
jgi:hypothetical protein